VCTQCDFPFDFNWGAPSLYRAFILSLEGAVKKELFLPGETGVEVNSRTGVLAALVLKLMFYAEV